MKFIKLLGITLLLSYSQFIDAQSSIHISGGRSFSNLDADPNIEAGSDLVGTFETIPAYIVLNLQTRNRYRISIRKDDINWDNNLNFYIRRTGNGNGPPRSSIAQGTNYIQLTNFNQNFFRGRFSRSNIPIQYKIDGISLLVPATGHTTNVVYTITGL